MSFSVRKLLKFDCKAGIKLSCAPELMLADTVAMITLTDDINTESNTSNPLLVPATFHYLKTVRATGAPYPTPYAAICWGSTINELECQQRIKQFVRRAYAATEKYLAPRFVVSSGVTKSPEARCSRHPQAISNQPVNADVVWTCPGHAGDNVV